MNRVKFQQWLEQFPEDAIVEVLVQEQPIGYEAWGEAEFQAFSGQGGHFEVLDFRDNKLVKPDAPYYGRVYLRLGNGE